MSFSSPQVGNVINAPGLTVTPFSTDVELLASTVGWKQDGVTLKPGQGVLLPGTPLVKDSSSAMYVKAATNATTVEGFLRAGVDTGSASSDPARLANILVRGIAKYSVIKAANGTSDLAAGAVTYLNGRIDTVRDYFIF